MDIDTLVAKLNLRFAAPLPEYYQRRIIFWYDEDKEFEDKLGDIHLDQATVIELNDSNMFTVKKQLSHDDRTSNFLVYDSRGNDNPEKDWLLDVKLYSEEFRADLISIWLNEMGLADIQNMRGEIKCYRVFFNAKERRSKVAAMLKTSATKEKDRLSRAVMACICGLKDISPNSIMKSVLGGGLDTSTNAIYQEFVSYGAKGAFWKMVQERSGYASEEGDLRQLAIRILLTAATRTMAPEYFTGLEEFISVPHQATCYDLVSEWLRSMDNHQLYELGRQVEGETNLFQRFMGLELEDLVTTECFPCIHEVILEKLLTDIQNQTINCDLITSVVDKRRTCAWYEQFANFYEGILQIANMQTFYKEHASGFHLTQAREIWKQYAADYYQMDRYYRQFHLCFQKSLTESTGRLDDLFKDVADQVEGLYSHWFLGELGGNWTTMCSEELANYGMIMEIPRQEDFYASRIQHAGSRVFVIISDAMRYEVAATLTEELRSEKQSQVSLNSVQGIFPTVTKFGMAALLPHGKLTVDVKKDRLAVLADGQSTESTNRDKVLKATNPRSVALQFKNIIGMKRAERSALVKGMEVVYIYHDTIDAASHITDTKVFPACETAISELKKLVNIIVNEFSGVQIYIIADHGFLYTYSPLQEDDKVDRSSFKGMEIEYDRRHVIMKKGAKPDYLLPVKFLGGKTDFEGFAPRENIRIKMNGGGMNFVHGGISLQELVVPVIDFHYLRKESKEYRRNSQKYDTKPVTVNLLSASRKVSNMIFSLNFFQKEAVSTNRGASTYRMYFTDSSGSMISDVQKIIADRKSENVKDRTFRCTFSLKSLKYSNAETYFLVIENEQGEQPPQREEFQIDIAFAVDGFNFLE